MTTPLHEKLKKELEGLPEAVQENFGRVIKIGDGIATVSGLSQVLASEMIAIYPGTASQNPEEINEGNAVYGLALNLEEYQIGVVILGEYVGISEGDVVKTTGRVLEVPVGEGLLGNVVDPLGASLEGKTISASASYPVEKTAPGVIARESVNEPLRQNNPPSPNSTNRRAAGGRLQYATVPAKGCLRLRYFFRCLHAPNGCKPLRFLN